MDVRFVLRWPPEPTGDIVSRMHDIPSTLSVLQQLCGSWSGQGDATFPTIGRYEYREQLRFVADAERPFLFFEQRAEQRSVGAVAFSPSHWEAGFLVVTAPGRVRLTNAQDNGRLEVLEMSLQALPSGLCLSGVATGHFNDPRMIGASREYRLEGDQLRYRVEMATTSVATPTLHLVATLSRKANERI